MNNLFKELRRRSVFRVTGVYAVVGWFMVQASVTLETALGLPGWFDGLVVSLLLIGFPIALILAWAFEITPEGMKRTEAGVPGASFDGKTSHKVDYAILAGLGLVVIVIVADRFVPNLTSSVDVSQNQTLNGETGRGISDSENGELSDLSIAVLPFVSMSQSKDDEFFADGLSEELLNVLANIDSLKVAARTSSFYFKGKNENLRTIGEILGVKHVLEGSVRRSGDQLRITAQLIKVDDGFHIWSETYDRTISDIFQIQDDISRQVAAKLKVALLGADESATEDDQKHEPEAQRLFLIAQAKLSQRGLENLRSARELFQQAVELDPEFARAHIGYANATLLLDSNHADLPTKEAILEAKLAAGIAVGLDPDESDVYATFGQIASHEAQKSGGMKRKQEALANFEQALSLNPRNVQATYWYAIALEAVGETQRALATYEHALSIDPLARVAHYRKGSLLMQLSRFDEAEDQLLDTLALFPEYLATQGALSDLETARGRPDRAVFWATHAYDANPQSFSYKAQLAVKLAELGETQAALDIVDVADDDPTFTSNFLRAIRYVILSDQQALYDLAQVLSEQGDQNWRTAGPLAAMMMGDLERARELFTEAFPEFYADDFAFERGGVDPQLVFAPAYVEMKLGNAAQARKLCDAAIAFLQSEESPYTGFRLHGLLTMGFAVLGDNKAAIAAFNAAYETGYRGSWVSGIARPENFPLFESVWSDPEFEAVMEKISADVVLRRETWNSGETTREIEEELEARGLSI